MAFIPHTKTDIKEMLEALGISQMDELFDEIPNHILYDKFQHIPESINENQLMRLMSSRAQQDHVKLNFMGAGAYEHHIPAAVWDITTRGEFMTAYTPYQAEASQGTLQLLYEYQTMIANLTGSEVSNASLYDGASALAEAVLMAVRIKKADHSVVLVPENIHPHYRETLESIITPQKIKMINLPIDENTGNIIIPKNNLSDFAVVVISQPNFFGILENVDNLTDWAHANQALVVAIVNPLSLAILKEPGKWGQKGADIVCGELQPFGIPLSSGGPYAGFLCTQQTYIRQMPGRIVGMTTDVNNQRGFTLTLQAREQHIRRGKAMSNICTNQGLLVTAATVYLSLLGFQGLKRVAAQCHENALYLYQNILALSGIKPLFDNQPAFFHEFAVQFDSSISLEEVMNKLADKNILGGYHIKNKNFPNSLIICATETKSKEDMDRFVEVLSNILSNL